MVDYVVMKNLYYVRIILFCTGVTFFGIGIGYYLWQRPPNPLFMPFLWDWLFVAHAQVVAPSTSPVESLNWLPTFIHVVSLSFITLSVSRLSIRGGYLIIGFWVSINILFELGQLFWVSGTYDAWDIVAALGAGLFVVAITESLFSRYFTFHGVITQHKKTIRQGRFYSGSISMASALVAGFGIASISGSYTYCEDSNGNGCTNYYDAEPVYMSYEELRTNAIYTKQNVPLTKTGKIYLYQNYLLVNSPNQGIHVYDNSDKQNPTHLTFINIPGNLDIAVKQDNLYVDSYIDLVVLDISNINDIQETHRVPDIFPYNAYQNVPEEIWMGPLDPSKGVVIGYKENN
jgi:hypothetical protein